MQSKSEKNIVKSLNQELMQVTYVAMQEGTDLHGDYTSAEEIRLAKESFNRALLKDNMANLFHVAKTDKFGVIESYIMPCDAILNGHLVTKGTWLMTLQVNNNDLWNMIKNDEIVGLSIGALAIAEEVSTE
jgi:hypothetical protein